LVEMSFDFGPAFIVSMVFGIFGMAYFAYGKKRGNFSAMGAGVGLMLYPYFVSDMLAVLAVGLALMAVPFLASRYL
jgi:hypothetical protein